MNADFQLCQSYPSILYVPRCMDITSVRECAAFRAQGRLPVLCYFGRRRHNALVRCADAAAMPR